MDLYSTPHLRLRLIAELVRRSGAASVVDIGAGEGYLAQLLGDVDYTGLDFLAPKPGAISRVIEWNMNLDDLPTDLKGTDCFVASGALEYSDNLANLITQVRKLIAENGTLCVSYFNMAHLHRALLILRGRSLGLHPNWRGCYTHAEFMRILEHNGFEIVKILPISYHFRQRGTVKDTITKRLLMRRMLPFSRLFATQFIYVAHPSNH